MSIYYQDELVTLYHADCLEELAWADGDVLVTDPPYGMAYVSGHRGKPLKAGSVIAGDKTTEVRDKVLAAWNAGIKPRPWLMFGTWRVPRPEGTKQLLIWDKTEGTGPGMGDIRSAFGTSHEDIYLGGTPWLKHRGTRRGSVIRTAVVMGGQDGLSASIGHPTPKPVPLMELLIDAAVTGTVSDPFAGSGSTLVAARNLGRKAIGVELEEKYCEIAARRLQQGAFELQF